MMNLSFDCKEITTIRCQNWVPETNEISKEIARLTFKFHELKIKIIVQQCLIRFVLGREGFSHFFALQQRKK